MSGVFDDMGSAYSWDSKQKSVRVKSVKKKPNFFRQLSGKYVREKQESALDTPKEDGFLKKYIKKKSKSIYRNKFSKAARKKKAEAVKAKWDEEWEAGFRKSEFNRHMAKAKAGDEEVRDRLRRQKEMKRRWLM